MNLSYDGEDFWTPRNKIAGSKLLDSSLSFGYMSKLSPEKGWMKE